jgi:hypothetical protein
MKKKKQQGLSWNTIIVAVIALSVLAVLILIVLWGIWYIMSHDVVNTMIAELAGKK